MKGLLLLADGFEETEAISTHDILLRTQEIECVLTSVNDKEAVVSSAGLPVLTQAKLAELNPMDFDFLILPGGKKGVENLRANERVIAAVKAFHQAGKPLFAICAAPSILGELGILDGKNYTCFPGFQKGNGHYQNAGSVIDGNIVTGHSMYFTIPFAEDIVRVLRGEEALTRIEKGTRGLE